MNGLQTEESGKKSFSFKPFLIIGEILLVLIVVIFLVIILVRNINTKKDKKTTDDDNIVSLNSELDGTYSFAKEGDYIVALKKNGYNRRIYNLSQGTGNLGDFIDYTYYDKKLYFLFGSNNIYSISLNEGNGVYELEEEYTYTPVLCSDNSSGLTSNILVTDKIIYFNNSGCGISGFNYKKKGKQVNVSTFNSNKYSSITHSDTVKKLFYQADNSLYSVNEANGEITKVLDNVNGSINLSITDNVLLYASTSDNKNYTYYGYNIVNGNNGEIVSNVKKLVISNKKYYYYTDNYVYVNDNGKVKEIYKSRYNVLSDMELINNNTLQVVDTSTALDKKEKIVNIDLSDKNYKSSVVNQKYSLIRIIQ